MKFFSRFSKKTLAAVASALAIVGSATTGTVLTLSNQSPKQFGFVAPGRNPSPGAPGNLAPPTVTGTTIQGDTLVALNGRWSNNPRFYSWQWRRCDAAGASCVNIGSSTGASYILSSGDVGFTIRVNQTAGNKLGSTTASSAQTVVITGTGGGGGGGGVVPNPPCTAPCNTTATIATPSFTVDDGSQTGTISTRGGTTIYAPTGLQADSGHKAALVLVLSGGGGLAMWKQVCQIKHCYTISVPSDTQSGSSLYAAWTLVSPYLRGNTYWTTGCGPGKAYHCDSEIFWQAIIDYAESHYSIDPNWVFAAGGSKGNIGAYGFLCDTRLTNLMRGSAAISGGGAQGWGTTELPVTLNCPAVGFYQEGNATGGEQAGVRHTGPLRFVNGYGDHDSVSCATTTPNKCTTGGVSAGGYWGYSADQINADMLAPFYGCDTSPTTVYRGTSNIDRFHIYGSCADTDTSLTTVQVTGNYHTWEGLSGADPYGTDYVQPDCNCANNHTNLALQTWNFWTTGTP